ncbi:hypothetical protein LPJ56_005892 [Coemansia sp. RSA 2599]|nr:hypothetical protein LPJ56_005892 [Coemansia sp. RSA 2599]
MVCVVCQISLFNPAIPAGKKNKGPEKEAKAAGKVSEESSLLAALHCGHVFHSRCINTWLQTSSSSACPLCTKAVEQSPVKLFLRIEEEDIAYAQPDKPKAAFGVDQLIGRISQLGIVQDNKEEDDGDVEVQQLIEQRIRELEAMARAQQKEIDRLAEQKRKSNKKKSALYSKLAKSSGEVKELMEQVKEKNKVIRSLENEVSLLALTRPETE